MINSFVKSVFTFLLLSFLSSHISLAFLFPDTIESETGEEILISKLYKNQTCIPLKNCRTLSWLKRKLPSTKYISQLLSLQNVSNILRSKRCVISKVDLEEEVTMETRVVCQKIHEKIIHEYKKDCGAKCANEDDLVVRRYHVGSLFELVRKKRIECSIELQHGELNNPLNDLQIKILSGRRKKYFRMRRLKNRRVLRVACHGSCCWRVYQKSGFKGDSTFIDPDNEVFPEHMVYSTQMVDCET